jgi:hypothetical protein
MAAASLLSMRQELDGCSNIPFAEGCVWSMHELSRHCSKAVPTRCFGIFGMFDRYDGICGLRESLQIT